ncbi:MAG: hypothetical protein L0209_01115, partial [candidate division Zixibacteria bacterium]|nr:hypothetical protein [candidate division Zixibacteria bacterium]
QTRFLRSGAIYLALTAFPTLFISDISFGLPKEKPAAKSPSKQAPAPDLARFTPLVLDDDEMRTSGVSYPVPVPSYLGPHQAETAASPYVDVRVGIPETPGGNNHMRRQVALSPTGTVHMVYAVIAGYSSADSAINFLYFYNAYNCNNSGELLIDPNDPNRLGLAMTAPGPPTDPRPRYMNQGGSLSPPAPVLRLFMAFVIYCAPKPRLRQMFHAAVPQ